MEIKVDKDIAKFINGICRDEKINRIKYVNRLLWTGIKREIAEDGHEPKKRTIGREGKIKKFTDRELLYEVNDRLFRYDIEGSKRLWKKTLTLCVSEKIAELIKYDLEPIDYLEK